MRQVIAVHPLPDVSRHVVQAIGTASFRITADRFGAGGAFVGIVGFGQHPYVAPRINVAVFAARRFFPFLLGGQAFAFPFAVGRRTEPGHIVNGKVFQSRTRLEIFFEHQRPEFAGIVEFLPGFDLVQKPGEFCRRHFVLIDIERIKEHLVRRRLVVAMMIRPHNEKSLRDEDHPLRGREPRGIHQLAGLIGIRSLGALGQITVQPGPCLLLPPALV